jgi:hypothetical protein
MKLFMWSDIPDSNFAFTVLMNKVLCAVIKVNENVRFLYRRGLLDVDSFRTLSET